jgi:putative transposase
MDKHMSRFRVTVMSRVLEVSRSEFYAWRKRRLHPSPGELRRRNLDAQVAAAFVARKGRSGSPGLTWDLRDRGRL